MPNQVYAGRVVLIKVDDNDTGGGSATWKTVGQQRGGGQSRTSETADTTNKEDTGWPSAIVTRTPWGVSCDGALDPTDAAWIWMLARWEAKAKIWVQIYYTDIGGDNKEGQAIITDLSSEFPESDVVSFTAEFQGDGALVTSP
jgi:predicted secreted protein